MARTSKQINTTGFSQLNIYNIALAKIGSERIQLAGLSANNEILHQCNLHYEPAVSELTRMHAWNCCLQQVEITATLTPVFGFGHAGLIGSAERVIEVTNSTSATLHTKRKNRFQVGTITDTTDKLAIEVNDRDTGNSNKIYATVCIAPTEQTMDGQFFNALTTYLASKLAVPIAGDFNRQFELLNDLYENILPEARKSNMAEGILQNEVDFETGLELPFKPFTYRNYERV